MGDLFGFGMLLPQVFVPAGLLLRVAAGTAGAGRRTLRKCEKRPSTWGFAGFCPIMVIMYSRNEKPPVTWAFVDFRPVGGGTCELLLRTPSEPGDYHSAE